MNEWLKKYSDRILSPTDATRKAIKSGDSIVFGHAIAAPESISKALYDLRENYKDLRVFHMLYLAEAWHMKPEMKGHLKIASNFFDANARCVNDKDLLDYIPCYFHEVPSLFEDEIYKVDVAAIQLSYPDENGYCSFGISADYTSTAAKKAKIVIAEINKQMPYIGGDNLIHISEIDYIIEVDRALKELPSSPIGDIERKIGEHCASLIKDGATLQLGIGAIPDAVLLFLEDRKDLGIHTEMFTDGVMHMMKKGIINGKKKTLHKEKVVTTLIMGSKELYDFIDKNDAIESYPVSYTNDPFIIAKNDNLVSINSCIEVDLMGQVASESIVDRQFSGTGGQVDFIRGAKKSKNGISILAMPSTAAKGTVSRIVPYLKEKSVTTATRNEADYIITEYGIARLKGKTLRERALSLVDISHPNFRQELKDYIKLYM